MFALAKDKDGAFVSAPGSAHSYTRDLLQAQLFTTREQAMREACGNEHVVDVGDLLRRRASHA